MRLSPGVIIVDTCNRTRSGGSMKQRAIFCLALVAFLASAFSSPTTGQQAPAGRQGGGAAPGARQGGPPPVQLPEGAGREQVQAACARCHGLNLIANSW